MGDKKIISVRKLATLERARALGLAIKRGTSPLEQAALEWKRGEMEESRQSEESEARDPARETTFFEPVVFNPSQGLSESVDTDRGFDWQPYRLEQAEDRKKVKDVNTASVSRIARKIMAREWAKALGRGASVESDQATIERKMEQYRKNEAAEKERKKIEEKRAHKQRKILEKALRSFGRTLLKAPKPLTAEMAEPLIEKAFADVGEFINISWQQDGCQILMEPWEEKKLRRKIKEDVPSVFQATVDDNLMLRSYERVEDSEVLQQSQNDLILKNILSSFRKSPQKDLHAFEDAVAERGRIIQSTKMNGGWKTHFEPWHEVRTRNVERGGLPPIVAYVIKSDKDFEHITCKRI